MENLSDKSMIDSLASSICSSNSSSYDVCSKECCSSPVCTECPIRDIEAHLDDDSDFRQMGSGISEMELMKERFAKLLLGEDMSGCGKGVCSALAISNAFTNLYASVFGQLWRLEPLQYEKKQMWQREMDYLLCVCDHIVELIPSSQTLPNGSKLEIMTSRPRSDVCINLPALRKLDNMLLEMLDTFISTEFGYIDQDIVAPDVDGSGSIHKPYQRHQEKWWMPVPRVPIGGLPEHTRNELTRKRECANQILKVVVEINSVALAEMEIPESYFESLPKNVRDCLGDVIYRYIKAEQFSAEYLLDSLDLSSQLVAQDIANRVETSIYIWRKRVHSIPNLSNPNRITTKFSWDTFKDLLSDGFKRDSLANRAESLLLCLKQRFPSLNQTSLDITKIQHNKDIGKSILESYSRVLESLASNIMARIDDLLYVDDLTTQSYNIPSHAGATTHKQVPISCITSTEMRGPMVTSTSVSRKENRNPNMFPI